MNYSFKMKARKIAIALVTGVTAISMSGLTAYAATTTLNANLDAGALTVTSPATASLPSASASFTTQDVTNSALGTITHSDLRGSGAGWATTVIASNLGYFYMTATSSLISVNATGTQAISDLDGRFNGLHCQVSHYANGAVSCGEFTLIVTTVDGFNYANHVRVIAPDGIETSADADRNHITVGGIDVTLGNAGAGVVESVLKLHVDSFSFTQTMYTPSSVTTVYGSSANVTNGSAYAFYGSGSEDTDLQSSSLSEAYATSGYGMGQYTTDSSLRWTLHGNAMTGVYRAVLTYTIA